MSERDYRTELYEKMAAEQNAYRDWLKAQSAEEVLNHAYEYTIREDIVMAMEELTLSPQQTKALLKSPCPLEDVFKEFRNWDTEHIDDIRESIKYRADLAVKREEERDSR